MLSAPTGNGCVGEVKLNGSCVTARSSTGWIGSPVSRSSRKKYPSARSAASAFRGWPSTSASYSSGAMAMSASQRS